jgi:hypothetical protein
VSVIGNVDAHKVLNDGELVYFFSYEGN